MKTVRQSVGLPVLSEKFTGDFNRCVGVGELVVETIEQIDVASNEHQRSLTV